MAAGTGRIALKQVDASMAENARQIEVPEAPIKKEAAPPETRAPRAAETAVAMAGEASDPERGAAPGQSFREPAAARTLYPDPRYPPYRCLLAQPPSDHGQRA